MLHFPEVHHFLAAFGSGQKMISEAATWAASSRRTCRRCGLNMKGLRPLHASPNEENRFVNGLRPPLFGTGVKWSLCRYAQFALGLLPDEQRGQAGEGLGDGEGDPHAV